MTKKRKFKQKVHARAERNDMSYAAALNCEQGTQHQDPIANLEKTLLKKYKDIFERHPEYLQTVCENTLYRIAAENYSSHCMQCTRKNVKRQFEIMDPIFIAKIFEEVKKDTGCSVLGVSEPLCFIGRSEKEGFTTNIHEMKKTVADKIPVNVDIQSIVASTKKLDVYFNTDIESVIPPEKWLNSQGDYEKIKELHAQGENKVKSILLDKIINCFINRVHDLKSKHKDSEIVIVLYEFPIFTPTIFDPETFTPKKGIMSRDCIFAYKEGKYYYN